MPSDVRLEHRPRDFSASIARAENSVRNSLLNLSRRQKRLLLVLILLASAWLFWPSGSSTADIHSPPLSADSGTSRDTTISSTPQQEVNIDTFTYFPTNPLSAAHDSRYSSPSSPATSPAALTSLSRSLLLALPDLGITPWLAHTTLLGWHSSHFLLPWATSPPTIHVSLQDLTHLATHYNGTSYSYPAPDGESNTTYLLDISPFYVSKQSAVDSSHGKGNDIDARYIDTATGLFIAITSVSLSSSTVSPDSSAQRGKGAKQKKLLRTRNGHTYDSKLVYPLQKSHFEGVECWVPGAAAVLLAQEFGKAMLTMRVLNGYKFDDKVQRWMPIGEKAG